MSRKMKMKRKMKRKFDRIYGKIELWVMYRILDILFKKRIEVSIYVLFYISNRELLYIYKNAERLIPELKENDQYALVIGFNPLNKHVDYIFR